MCNQTGRGVVSSGMMNITQNTRHLAFSLTFAALFAVSFSAAAQQRLSSSEAQYYARLVHPTPPRTETSALSIQPDLEKAVALREDIYGGMLIPDKRLSKETLAQAAKGTVGIGELWFRNLAPMKNGWVVSKSDLNVVDVATDEGKERVPCCALGLRNGDNGKLELLVFGKGKEPLLALPLEKAAGDASVALDMSAEAGYDQGWVILKVFGQYQARFSVTELYIY